MDDNFVISEIKDWQRFLSEEDDLTYTDLLKVHANSGRPLGDSGFISQIERLTGRILHKRKPGPKGKEEIIK